MPIIEPKSLNALNIVPFQINPHFVDNNENPAESREHQIEEFMKVNPDSEVFCLRNGSFLKIIDKK